ncbi:unnamed protein product [Rodentolepis nana]|uniref:ATP synthase F1 subunit gamma n=1 Tax=Rodentolepis nana TaxID=102285 RepID=A0A0R3TFG2_RODNA|nr:unnamed protein product [Rodentolepis nana]
MSIILQINGSKSSLMGLASKTMQTMVQVSTLKYSLSKQQRIYSELFSFYAAAGPKNSPLLFLRSSGT